MSDDDCDCSNEQQQLSDAWEDRDHWCDLAREYQAKLQQAEDADLAFRIQVRKDCENAESAPARIKAALGEYGKDWTGDWLDEAVARLRRERSFTRQHFVERVADVMRLFPGDAEAIADLALNVLGVTLSTDRPASPIDGEGDPGP